MVTGKIKKFGITAALAALMSVALVACGGEASSTSAPEAAPTNTAAASAPADTGSTENMTADSADVQEVDVTLKEWAIEPSNIEVNAGMVRFNVANTGQFSHNMAFQIEGEGTVAKTPNFKSGDGTQVLEVELEPGTYKMLCDIIGHPEQGMVGTLTVK